ncbi:hypothetical protein [Thermus sp.]|uniref:hypothetical protein n=1 Tax=Thermus sp. TaxID=275 RepID=UPI003D0EA79E
MSGKEVLARLEAWLEVMREEGEPQPRLGVDEGVLVLAFLGVAGTPTPRRMERFLVRLSPEEEEALRGMRSYGEVLLQGETLVVRGRRGEVRLPLAGRLSWEVP